MGKERKAATAAASKKPPMEGFSSPSQQAASSAAASLRWQGLCFDGSRCASRPRSRRGSTSRRDLFQRSTRWVVTPGTATSTSWAFSLVSGALSRTPLPRRTPEGGVPLVPENVIPGRSRRRCRDSGPIRCCVRLLRLIPEENPRREGSCPVRNAFRSPTAPNRTTRAGARGCT